MNADLIVEMMSTWLTSRLLPGLTDRSERSNSCSEVGQHRPRCLIHCPVCGARLKHSGDRQ